MLLEAISKIVFKKILSKIFDARILKNLK